MAADPDLVLCRAGIPPAVVADIEGHYPSAVLPADPSGRAELLAARAGEVAVLVTSAGVGADADLIESLPRLRAIVSFGVGYDSIDLDAAARRGVVVSNTPGVLNACVADLAVALLLDLFRTVSAADRFVRRGDWLAGGYPLARKFSGSRIGIVGLGRIGRDVARRLEAFDVRLAYHNRRKVEDVEYRYLPTLEDLARESDALVVVVAGGPQTRHLISRSVLRALRGGFLVNVARGSVVDEEALVELLVDGTLAGAGLDVYEREPQVPEHLSTMDNVVLAPHVGSATAETRAAMTTLTLENLHTFMSTGALTTPLS